MVYMSMNKLKHLQKTALLITCYSSGMNILANYVIATELVIKIQCIIKLQFIYSQVIMSLKIEQRIIDAF